MKFFKLIRYDIKNGFWQSRWKLLAVAVLVLISCADFYIQKTGAFRLEEVMPSGTFADYACYLLGGMPEYHPEVGKEFVFPAKWFLFHLILLYGTLHYSVRDLYSVGIVMLPRCGQRSFWWLSKCLWNILYILAAYLVSFGTICVFCMVKGESLALPITGEFMNTLMKAESPFVEFPLQFSVVILVVPCILSMGNSLLMLLLTLFLKPVLSYGAMLIFLLCGAYFNVFFFWGSLTMPLRSQWVMQDGYTFSGAVVTAAAVIAGALLIGLVKFRKYDILNLESE